MLSKYFKFMFIILTIFDINCNCTLNHDKVINEFVVQISGGYSEAISVAKQTGFIVDHKMIGFNNLFIFKYKRNGTNVHRFFQHRVKRSTKVTYIEQQIVRKRVKRKAVFPYLFSDPLYHMQWYLMRSQLHPNQFDMNVVEAWNMGYTGKGVVVSILDDGIDYRHPDLKDNYDPKASYDINGGDSDPLPNFMVMDNRHGTRCAGEVAAKENNNKCGVGVAYNSRIGAVRMLDGEVTDRVEAEALAFNQDYIDIYSGSWGPDDNGQKVEGPAQLAKAAFEKGVKNGRKGRGNIYVWASGNGGNKKDSCACDGYASSIYTISVSSVSELNLKPWFLESCASTLISTYSSGGPQEKQVITTDLNGNCALDHTGTSASAPLAAGIIALLLEANPTLTWRDVQYITVVTANTSPFDKKDFITNGANRKVSNLYGFGLMDSGKMIRLGKLWHTLPPQHVCKSYSKVVNRNLSGEFVESVSIIVDGCSGNNRVNYVEHVLLYLGIEYQKRGDLNIYLISPSGTRSEILPYRIWDLHSGNATFDKWPLTSVQFWGEFSSGSWILEIKNKPNNKATMQGVLHHLSLEIYGTDKSPMTLKPPTEFTNDNWFQQFERFVVYGDYKDLPPATDFYKIRSDTNGSERANIKCHDLCFNNTCNEWGPRNCASCKRFQMVDGTCVNNCSPRTFLNDSSRTCEACHYSCDECIGFGKNNCSRCHVGDSFKEGPNQCKMSTNGCEKGFFKDSVKCTKCPMNCSICTSLYKCSQCQDGFVLTLNSLCKPSCDVGTYNSRGICRACHFDCLTCLNGNPNECTSCSQGSYILPIYEGYKYGRCISDCGPRYFTNYTTGVCYGCSEDCKTCTDHMASSCTDCKKPLELSNAVHRCIDPITYTCKADEFYSVNMICEKCPKNCKTCIDDQCTSCHSDRKFIYNNSCVETCPKGYFSISNDNICLPCNLFCNLCNSDMDLSECTQCSKSTRNCINHCNKNEYWNYENKSCSTCHSSCSMCSGGSSSNCIKCLKSDHFLSSGLCIKSCKGKEHAYITSKHKLCIPCHPSCKGLLCDAENGRCLQCPKGHKMSIDGHCERIINCQLSHYLDQNKTSCFMCNKSCHSCSARGQCLSCHQNYCLNPKFGTCHPCCSLFLPVKNCLNCNAGKEFCDIFDLQSLSLQSRLFPNLLLLYIIVYISFVILFALLMVFFYWRYLCKTIEKWYPIKRSVGYSAVKSNVGYDQDRDLSSDELSENENIIFQKPYQSYISFQKTCL